MSDDFTLELFQNAVEKHIAHLKEHGTSDEKIANALAHADFLKHLTQLQNKWQRILFHISNPQCMNVY